MHFCWEQLSTNSVRKENAYDPSQDSDATNVADHVHGVNPQTENIKQKVEDLSATPPKIAR